LRGGVRITYFHRRQDAGNVVHRRKATEGQCRGCWSIPAGACGC
jgi:hypothetical protein